MLVHDASYHAAIQLEGPEAGIYFTSYLMNLFLGNCIPFNLFFFKRLSVVICSFLLLNYDVTTFFICIQDSLLSVLGMVMVPPPSTRFENVSRSVISGLIYDNAMVSYPIALFFVNVDDLRY